VELFPYDKEQQIENNVETIEEPKGKNSSLFIYFN
jgi:hypothetical protein